MGDRNPVSSETASQGSCMGQQKRRAPMQQGHGQVLVALSTWTAPLPLLSLETWPSLAAPDGWIQGANPCHPQQDGELSLGSTS